MTAPDWLFATIRDLGKQVRAERERADAAEARLLVSESPREAITTAPTYTSTPEPGEAK
jgi:hypothetical protein